MAFDLGAVFVTFKTKMEGFDEAIGKMQKQVKTAQDSTKNMQKVGEGMVSFGKKMSTAITLPFLAAGAVMVKSAADYEQGLNIFKSVSGATAAEMEKVSARAKELGNDITLPGVSAADAAGAMTELAKAGLSVNDTLSASKGVLSLAKAGQLDTAYAAEITANALLAFKMRGDEANKVADMLAATANATSADVTDMAQALQQAGAQAASMGLPLQDTVTLLGELANVGIKGSDAGTSLKTFLQRLVPTTDEAREAFKKLNIDMFDANGKFIGTRAAIEQLQKGMGSLNQEQRQTAIATIFGTDASRAANTIIDQGVTGYDKLYTSVGKVGAAQELAAAQNSGFKGALDNFKSTLETIAITLGTKLLPPLTNFMKKLAAFFGGLSEGQLKAVVAISAVLAVLGPLILITGKIITSTKTIIATMKTLGIIAKLMGTQVVGAIKMIGTAISFLAANPIILVIIGIVLAIAALAYVIYRNWDTLKKWFGEFWQGVKEVFQKGIDWIKKHWDILLAILIGPLGLVIGQIVKNWDKIKDGAVAAFNTVKEFVVGIWNAIKDGAAAAWNFIWRNIIKPVVDLIMGYFRVMYAVYYYIFALIRGVAIVVWNYLWNNVIKPVIDFIVNAWNTVRDTVTNVFNSIVAAAQVAWNWLWNNIIKPVIDYITMSINNMVFVVTTAWDWIVAKATAVWNWLWTNVISPVVNAIVAGFNWLAGIVIGIWNTVSNAVVGAWNWIVNAAQGAWNWVANIWNRAMGFFEGIKNTIKNAFSSAWDGIASGASSAFEGAKNIVKSAINWMIDKVNGVIRKVNGSAGKLPGVPDIPEIPKLARGVQSFRGGLAMVGEMGPELVNMPQGSSVTPAQKTEELLKNQGGDTYHVHLGGIYAKTRADVRELAKDFLGAVDEERIAKGKEPILGGA